jgi:hypothetical protein
VTTFALIGSWRERMFLKVALSWAQSNAERWWCVRRAALDVPTFTFLDVSARSQRRLRIDRDASGCYAAF